MNRPTLPRVLFSVLVAGAAAAQPAVALPPDKPVLVDDAVLAGISGKYYGASMLVGLRIDLVSSLHTAYGSASATGVLSIRSDGAGGFTVLVGTDSQASAADSPSAAPVAGQRAVGADTVQINGIGQLVQIAGDDNRMGNLTTIGFGADAAPDPAGFNNDPDSAASAGPMQARISFAPGGASIAVSGPQATLGQQFNPGSGGERGRILQVGQMAGNGMTGSNRMHLQLMTTAMPTRVLNQLGVEQALSGLAPLGR